MELFSIIYFFLFVCFSMASCVDNPNIVFILADDMGWNDVSCHGSDQILTPNIDMLTYSGVGLGRYYSHAACTPSRAAFLTGKYSHKTGMQGLPLSMTEDRGIPVNVTLLPEYFKAAGYATYLIGKWHVGSSRNEYLPTARGFDSHFGHRGGFVDYYEYTVEEVGNLTQTGLLLYKNHTPAWDVEGYITDVYTDYATNIIKNHDGCTPFFLMVAHNAPHAGPVSAPLQAPPKEVRKLRHIEVTSRRMFGAMVKKLDDSVGDIVEALNDKGILENTLIVFASDNGGMTTGMYQNYASNYPLRGIKMSPFEGGIRVVGAIWSANLKNKDHYWDGYMHVSDWMPTLLSAAGLKVPTDIDGINQWDTINRNKPSQRHVMYEIDDYAGHYSIIFGQYKLVTGNVPRSHGTYQGADLRGIIGNPPSYTNAILDSKVYKVLGQLGLKFDIGDLTLRNKGIVKCKDPPSRVCFPGNGTVCLFNIIEDPCETKDLSKIDPNLVAIIKSMLNKEIATRIPRKIPFCSDPLSAPSRFNYTWTPWLPDSVRS